MSDNHHFIITNLDTHAIDLEPYQYSGTNITTLRIVNPENPVMETLLQSSDLSVEVEEEEEESEGISDRNKRPF